MDYRYIEQLLERYWQCETTAEEESILRTFFSQRNLPESLARYRNLFVYVGEEAKETLPASFDSRLLAAAGIDAEQPARPATPVKARRITLSHRLRPLYRAAAMIAVVMVVGIAAQRSFQSQPTAEPQGWDYNQSAYKDSYQDPTQAYEATEDILQKFKRGAQTAVADSSHLQAPQPADKPEME